MTDTITKIKLFNMSRHNAFLIISYIILINAVMHEGR